MKISKSSKPSDKSMSMVEIDTIDTPDHNGMDGGVREDNGQMEIKLVSKLPERYQIPSDKMIVPGSLTRIDLSELVNDFLAFNERVPFDFLVNGEFLRGSILTHCTDRGILSEKTVELEYVIAMEEPKSTDLSSPQSDWISGIALTGSLIFSCSMDGVMTKYDANTGKQLGSAVQGALPLTGVAASDNGIVITTSRDGFLRVATIDTLEIIETGRLEQGIQSVSLCPFDPTLALTGSIGGSVHLWNVPMSVPVSKSGKKRASSKQIEPRAVLINTGSDVTSICWLSLSRAMVGCLDGTIHVLDPLTGQALPTVSTNRPVTAMCLLEGSRLVTGHPDGRIIFWNLHVESSVSLEALNSCRSHSRMISALASRPGDQFLVASASVDGCVKLFDSRASHFAVQSISLPKGERALAVAWSSENLLFSAGSDGVIRTHTLSGHQ